MAGVKIDSGKFPLMRDVDVNRQPERSKVYSAWIRAFSYSVPDAVEHLADIIEDVYAYELWKDNFLDTPEAFFDRMGILGLNLDEPAQLIKDLRKKRSKVKHRIIQQAKEWAAKREAGESLREIAAWAGVSKDTVQRRVSQKNWHARKSETQPRTRTTYQIQSGTKPETAAAKIRGTFGSEFALALGTLLVSA